MSTFSPPRQWEVFTISVVVKAVLSNSTSCLGVLQCSGLFLYNSHAVRFIFRAVKCYGFFIIVLYLSAVITHHTGQLYCPQNFCCSRYASRPSATDNYWSVFQLILLESKAKCILFKLTSFTVIHIYLWIICVFISCQFISFYCRLGFYEWTHLLAHSPNERCLDCFGCFSFWESKSRQS